jgi:hypothetical protein
VSESAESLANVELAVIRGLYHFRGENVADFLRDYPNAMPLLRLAHSAIQRYFGAHAVRVEIEIDSDSDAGGDTDTSRELFVVIQCDLDADEGLGMLDKFDAEWWYFASQLEDIPLNFEAEYRGI